MTSSLRGTVWLAVAVVWASRTIAQEPANVAALNQYRLAQRLGADGSSDAAAAFEKVVTLAPDGQLADDALVDLACVYGAPEWPEALGGLDAARAAQAKEPLVRVVAAYPGADRSVEARYRLALLRLAPLPGRDAAAARQDLILLASIPSRGRWGIAARYALGVLDAESLAPERAAGAFARIVVERPESDVAPRALVGLGRTMLLAERFDEAAGWFQQAIERGVASGLSAEALRELALREILRQRSPGLRWSAIAAPLPSVATSRGASLIVTGAAGAIVVFDRKRGVLQAFDAKGTAGRSVATADIAAMASDVFGRVFVATKDKLVRWEGTGFAPIANLTDFGSPSAIAVDGAGTVWIADRKGDRIARWSPGSTAPTVVRERKGEGVAALAVAGGRVIAADAKTGRLFALDADGSESNFGATTFRRPVALAVDAAGRVSVLDEKANTVTRLSPSGEVRDTLAIGTSGVSRPLALATAPEGSVRILDGSTGSVAVTP